VTEIYDYLRSSLRASASPTAISADGDRGQTVQQITTRHGPARGDPHPGAGAHRARRKGEYRKELMGGRFRLCPGAGRRRIKELSEPVPMDKKKKHDIEIVIDRIVVKRASSAARGKHRNGAQTG